MEQPEKQPNALVIDPVDEPGVSPISIRLTGASVIVADTSLSLTITTPPPAVGAAVVDNTIYDLSYYQLVSIEDGRNPGEKTVTLQEIVGTGITQIPDPITQYGNAAGAVLQLTPGTLGAMQLVILATPQGTPPSETSGLAVVPIAPVVPQ